MAHGVSDAGASEAKKPLRSETREIGVGETLSIPAMLALDTSGRMTRRAPGFVSARHGRAARAIACDQRIEPLRAGGVDPAFVVCRKMPERRPGGAIRRIGLAGEAQRLTKLVEIVVIAECWVLVEPFGRERFRCSAFSFASGLC